MNPLRLFCAAVILLASGTIAYAQDQNTSQTDPSEVTPMTHQALFESLVGK